MVSGPDIQISDLNGYWEITIGDGRFFWSEEARLIHDAAPDQVNDMVSLIKLYHPDDQAAIEAGIHQALDNATGFQLYLRCLCGDQTIRQLRTTGVVRQDQDGQPEALTVFCQDVTTDWEMLEALKYSEAKFRALVDNIPSAILIKDSEGRYQNANQKWHEWFNPEGRQIEGLTAHDFYPSDYAAGIIAQDLEVLRRGTSIDVQNRSPLSGGSSFPCLVQKFPVFDDQSNIVGISSVTTDLTEIKRAEDTQARLFEALEHTSEGYALYDSDRRFIHCNSRYREFYPWLADVLVPGNQLEDIVRIAAERGQDFDEIHDINAWVNQRLNVIDQGLSGYTQTLKDGRILFASETRLKDGSYMGTRTDITELKQAEAELQVSERRFRRLFDSAEVSIWDEDLTRIATEFERLRALGISDLDQYLIDNPGEAYRLAGLFRVNSVNDATLKLYGASSQSEFIENVGKIINEMTITAFVAVLNVLWTGGDYFRIESSHQTLDGRDLTIYLSFPIPEDTAEWNHIPVCIIDITDRKTIENELRLYQETLETRVEERTQKLRVSEQRQRDLIDGSLQGIIVHLDSVPVFVNDVFADIHGYSVDELMALKSMRGLLADHEVDRLSEFAQLRSDGQDIPVEYEYQARTRDGRLIWLLNRARRVNWDDKVALQNTVIDITSRKEAEQALIESERQFRGILETSPIGSGITNAPGDSARFVNDAHLKLLGVTREEFGNTPGRDFWIDQSHRERFLQDLRQTGRAQGEIRLRRKDGPPFWAIQKWVISPINKEDILFWVYDISELKDAQQEMMQARDEANRANKAKSDFLSSMSHELRTPLNSILGFAQLLQISTGDPLSEDQKDSVNRILDGGHHLLDLVNDVLDLARIESGTMTVSIKNLSPVKTLEECLVLISPKASDRGLTIAVPEGLNTAPLIQADEMRLKQILLNLLSNAVKYNRENGRITVALKKTEDRMLRFLVTDTGMGICEKDQKDLFTPFNRLGAENTNIEGTGIGLTVTRELADLMHGRVGMQSTVGEGSTFWFDLPLSDDA